jgi:hypothetical protein
MEYGNTYIEEAVMKGVEKMTNYLEIKSEVLDLISLRRA